MIEIMKEMYMIKYFKTCTVQMNKLLTRWFSGSQTDDAYQLKMRLEALEHAQDTFC